MKTKCLKQRCNNFIFYDRNSRCFLQVQTCLQDIAEQILMLKYCSYFSGHSCVHLKSVSSNDVTPHAHNNGHTYKFVSFVLLFTVG